MASNRLEFRVLGPLTVRVDGVVVPAGGPKQRAVLAQLLLSANRVVSRQRLIDELFAEQSLNSADHALRNQVSGLRKVLAPAAPQEPRLVARAPGYLLRVEPGELDLENFERLLAAGRDALAAGDPASAAESLRAAGRLWQGRPLADLEFEPFTRVEVERLEELRLAAIEERVARLADVPLFAIVGPSGSGKSSLLRAGLLPSLGPESMLVRPGERSAAELRAVLDRVPPGERIVLAVDQFEELFTSSVEEHERQVFVEALVEAAWDPERRALILIALRADLFGRLAPYVELADLVGSSNVLLGPMTTGELRRAIEGPAERTGLEVEPALVDALVEDVAGEPGGLSLLSTVLLDLWRARNGPALSLAAYERTGGVRGAVGRHAEAAFRALDEDEQKVARRILLRLVEGGGGEVLTRRRATRVELDADDDQRVARVLAVLVERRLLVADDGTVELVHEALLERWPRLGDWLEEDAQGRRLHRHLTQATTEWDAAGREPSELYRGARLAATLEWAEAAGDDAGLNRLESDFLEQSRAAFARANRRLRALLAVAVLLLVAALATGA